MPDAARPPSEYTELYAAYAQAFERAAAQAGGSLERELHLAGQVIRLRFAGPGLLAGVLPALAHLETAVTPGAAPDLVIHLWDEASTGARLPLALSELTRSFAEAWTDHLDARGEITRLTTGRFRAAFHPGPNFLSLYDRQARLGWYWRQDASAMPAFERGSPLRTLLHWWSMDQGRQMVHAGAVGEAHGGLLLAGKGGSGKSTSTLACLQAGMGYAGDDYCLLSMDDAPRVHCVYNSAKLIGEADLQRFPGLAGHFQAPQGGEKALVCLHPQFAAQVARSLPLRGILLLELNHTPETRLLPATPAAALAALAPTTLAQLPGAGPAVIQWLARLVQRTPCFTLSLGTQVERTPDVLRGWLAAA